MSVNTWLLIIVLILQLIFVGLFLYFFVRPSMEIQENVNNAKDQVTSMICGMFPNLPMCKEE